MCLVAERRHGQLLWLLIQVPRQFERCRKARLFIAKYEPPAMQLANGLDETEAQTVSMNLRVNHLTRAVERIEYLFEVFFRDPDAPVFD